MNSLLGGKDYNISPTVKHLLTKGNGSLRRLPFPFLIFGEQIKDLYTISMLFFRGALHRPAAGDAATAACPWGGI